MVAWVPISYRKGQDRVESWYNSLSHTASHTQTDSTQSHGTVLPYVSSRRNSLVQAALEAKAPKGRATILARPLLRPKLVRHAVALTMRGTRSRCRLQ